MSSIALVRDAVGLALDLLDLAGPRLEVVAVLGQLQERLGCTDDPCRVPLEQVEERVLSREEALEHVPARS
jgi:hypothetical protein